MLSKAQLLALAKQQGTADASTLQSKVSEMTGTELYEAEDQIPDFQAAKAKMNMLQRKVGFVCRSTAGRVVKLLQTYNSETYPAEPEDLKAQWGFKWSTDPAKALPFIKISTSPYGVGECCTEGGHVYQSKIDDNSWSPSGYPNGWTDLGTIEEVQQGATS